MKISFEIVVVYSITFYRKDLNIKIIYRNQYVLLSSQSYLHADLTYNRRPYVSSEEPDKKAWYDTIFYDILNHLWSILCLYQHLIEKRWSVFVEEKMWLILLLHVFDSLSSCKS